MHVRPRGASLGGLIAAALAVGLLAGGPAHAIGQGEPAPAGSYGFVARIEIGDSYRACSGALIDPRWILTAASCFADGQPVAAGPPTRVTTAVVGRTDLTGTAGHAVRVVELVPHPDRDVLLAKLATPVTDVAPIALATSAPAASEVLRVAGYGRTETEWIPERLHTAAFAVQSVAAASVQVTSSAGGSVCRGDAGGPAFRESGGQVQLVAVTSSAQQAGCLGETATERGVVQARVDNLAGWVGQHVATVLSGAQLAVRSFSSEETTTNNQAVKAIDGDPATFWHTKFVSTVAQPPHEIQLDLRATRVVSDLFYLPRQDHPNGRIGNYEVYVSADGSRWGAPVAAGTFPNGTTEQEISFIPKTGRYVRLRSLSGANGGAWATVAELRVGVVTSAAPVTVRSVDSEETSTSTASGAGINAVDGDPATFWHTKFVGTIAPLPHEIQLDLGAAYPVADLYYLPRQDHQNGRIARYEVYLSADATNWGTAVATGTFANSTALQSARFPATVGRYVRLRALSEVGGGPWTSVAELGVGIRRSGLVGPLKVRSFSSEETTTNNQAVKAVDGNPATFWHTKFVGTVAQPPHEIALDLGTRYAVTNLYYLPRQDNQNGRIAKYEVYLSTDGTNWGTPVATGTFPAGTALADVAFPATPARYVKLRALSELAGGPWASAAELSVGLSAASGGSAVPTANSLNPQPSTVETYDYPGADQILAQHGLTLFRGDGHILFVTSRPFSEGVQCDPGQVQVEMAMASPPFGVYYCFRTVGTQGYLTLRVPGTFIVRGGDRALQATVEPPPGEQQTTFDIPPNTPVTIYPGDGSELPQAVLVELRLA
jgi:Trypsin/F5/8 type C domain